MGVKDYTVVSCSRKEIASFIEENHYSKSINGVMSTYCFKLMDGNTMIGAAIFGGLGMANNWKKFANTLGSVVELRRLCCIDDTPKNTESYFIGKMLKYLKKHTSIQVVVSYADENQGHTGVIYQASNFIHRGMTARSKFIHWQGRVYHDKAVRTKYKGKLKPFAERIKVALEKGEAFISIGKAKHCYTYTLHKRG